MSYATSYSIANAATVNQTWVRTDLGPGYAKYVNDTARAAGIEEFFEIRSTTKIPKKSGATSYTSGRWNLKLSSRIIASELEPLTLSVTLNLTDSLANALTTARSRMKDMRLVFVALSDTDPEIDDATACRTQ